MAQFKEATLTTGERSSSTWRYFRPLDAQYIGRPDIIGPAIPADGNRVAASVIGVVSVAAILAAEAETAPLAAGICSGSGSCPTRCIERGKLRITSAADRKPES